MTANAPVIISKPVPEAFGDIALPQAADNIEAKDLSGIAADVEEKVNIVVAPAPGQSVAKDAGEVAVLQRIFDFLDPVEVMRNTSAKPLVGFFGASLQLVTAGFVTDEVSDVAGDTTKLKETVFNEQANMGIISALVATIVFPMFLGFTDDWVENAHQSLMGTGYEEWLIENGQYLVDTTLWTYAASSFALFFSVMSSIYILIGVNSMVTGDQVNSFVNRMGRGMRMPYLFFQVGMVFNIGLIIRVMYKAQTWFCVVCFLVSFIPMILGLCLVSQIHCVKCIVNTREGSKAFHPFELEIDRINMEVAEYFKQKPNGVNLQGLLRGMQAETPNQDVVQLTPLTVIRIKVAFHKQYAVLIGLENLSEADIYGLVF